MSQKTRKEKSSPTTSLKNITNTKARGSLNSKQKCVIKMQKIDIEILKAANDANDKDIKSTTKPLKRKPKRSDENLPSSKKKPPVSVQSAAPTTTETPKTTKASSSPSSSLVEAAPAVVRDEEQSVENQIRKYEQLQKVISNKYVTVVDRLNLSYVPFCCENLEFCQRKHYKRAPSPKLPSANQMNLIRSALQQSRYNAFISLVWGLCLKDQFPGDIVLTNIIKLILSLNPEHQHNSFLQNIIDQLLCLFDVILKTFPPCWLALRKSYITFLRNTMEISRLFPDKPLNAENTIFEVILMLLEDNLDDGENIKQNRSLKKKRGSLNTSSSLALNNYDNEYYNMQHWEKNDNDEQTFSALSKDTRIERIMQVLHFLAKMLEMDMAMWMLRYHKNPAKYIYNASTQPLVIELFALSEYKSSSVLVKKVMSLFSLCVEKDLNQNYLSIMDRFISLLANVQNLREVENTNAGIKYPIVGPRTSAFTMELYKTAEVNMKTSVRTYLRLVKNLNCPFVRYEYIDIFLKRLNPAAGKMGPQKIFENFRKNRWLECALDEERPLDESLSKLKSIVYRQDYLKIILEALRSYCDYFALKDFFQEFVGSTQTKEDNNNILKKQQKSDSNQRKPQSQYNISSLRKNIVKLEKNLDMSAKMQMSKIDIPTLNIAVNAELLSQYRNDLKYVTNLHSYISALQHEHDEDFSEMIEFLKDFALQC
ncbi:uncharacterized protein LOC129947564 [Eupeodes corollae]|uniref:uncharacterized protein LOC129947564 n=1 Tax=Eupeodes corollae TaxID=290404 RepID=UPI0024926691|nr:uncharacterized protein LOC129947564 [Eupeodes corollae]